MVAAPCEPVPAGAPLRWVRGMGRAAEIDDEARVAMTQPSVAFSESHPCWCQCAAFMAEVKSRKGGRWLR